MRKYFPIASILLLFAINSSAQGSMNGPLMTPRDLSAYQNFVNINGQDGFYLKKDLYLVDKYTIIDGQRVLGIPFLFDEWNEGTLTTPDGRAYTDYKFKYNAENQTVFFKNGTDSMEANEDIKDFVLKVKKDDSIFSVRFVNAVIYHKTIRPLYYEVLLDNERAQVLKLNKKVVRDMGDGPIAPQTRKYLNLEPTYFYYDKQTKKFQKVKSTVNIVSFLKLTDEEAKELYADTFDFSHEENTVRFFKLYHEYKKRKGL